MAREAEARDEPRFKPRRDPTTPVTYCGVIRDPRCDDLLLPMGWTLSRARHWTFAQLHVHGRDLADVKRDAQPLFGITSRQFDSVRVDVDQAVNGWAGALDFRIADAEERIEAAEEAADRLARRVILADGPHRQRWLATRWTAQRIRVDGLRGRLESARRERAGRPRVGFGNDALILAGDVAGWRVSRASSIFLVGCSGEPGGNQTAALRDDGTLRVRLPDAHGGAHVHLTSLRFRFGQREVERATRRRLSMSWRLFRDPGGTWHAHVTVGTEAPPVQGPSWGMLSVDLNVDSVAAVGVDRHCNVTLRLTLPFPDHRVPSGRAAAMIGDAVRDVCKWAESLGYGVAAETLDLARKKARLREYGRAHARRLSGLAYARFAEVLSARCRRMRLRLDWVNPAYTSVIGLKKFARHLSMGRHHAAALVIGRRALGICEVLRTSDGAILVGPGRDRPRTDWRRWKDVRRLPRPGAAVGTGTPMPTEGPKGPDTQPQGRDASHGPGGVRSARPQPSQGRRCPGELSVKGRKSPSGFETPIRRIQ